MGQSLGCGVERSNSQADCIFCDILDNDVDKRLIYQDELVAGFQDISPSSEVHLLLIPNEHIPSVYSLGKSKNDVALLKHMLKVAFVLQTKSDQDTLSHGMYIALFVCHVPL